MHVTKRACLSWLKAYLCCQRAIFGPVAGRPEFGIDVDNIKPAQVVVAAAVAMLMLGKPLSGSRGFGGMQFGLPVSGDAVAKVRIVHCLCACIIKGLG